MHDFEGAATVLVAGGEPSPRREACAEPGSENASRKNASQGSCGTAMIIQTRVGVVLRHEERGNLNCGGRGGDFPLVDR